MYYMQKNSEGIVEIDLLKILALLLKKLYIIVLCAILCGAGAFAYAKFKIKPTYQSTAYIYVNNSSVSIGEMSLTTGDLNASKSLVDTYIVILKTRNTLETVIKKAGLDYSYNKLSGMISASAVNDTEIFKVTVTSTDPKEACEIVNTIAEVFPDKVSSIVNGTSAKIVDYGVINTNKVAPSNTRYTLIGAFAGACLAVLVIVIIYLTDDTVRDEEYLISTYDVPIIGTIPSLLEKDNNKYKQYNKDYKYRYSYQKKKENDDSKEEHTVLCEKMHFDAKEAYKLLRTNLQFALNDTTSGACKVVGVTSAVRGEGKSTTSCNLAYTLAQANQKVLLIDGDMRLPSISSKLNVKNKVGLSDYVIGNASIKDVIYAYSENLPNFHVLLSGTIPPNPSELLGSQGMKDTIEKLKKKYDYIIIDLPPVNIVTDALVTKEYIDGIVVTIRQNYSAKREVNDCIRSIEFLESNLLGFIFTNVFSDRSYYSPKIGYRKYYSYKYGRKYYKDYSYRYGYEKKEDKEKKE